MGGSGSRVMSPIDSHDYHYGQFPFFPAYFLFFCPSTHFLPSLRPLGLFPSVIMPRCTVSCGVGHHWPASTKGGEEGGGVILHPPTKCGHSAGHNIDIVRPIDAQKSLDGCSYASSQLSVLQGPGGPSYRMEVDGGWVVGRGHIVIVLATSLLSPTESISNGLPSPSLPFAGSAEAIHRRHLRLLVPA